MERSNGADLASHVDGMVIRQLCFSTAVAVAASMLDKIEELLLASMDITRDELTKDRMSMLISEMREVKEHAVNLAEITNSRAKASLAHDLR